MSQRINFDHASATPVHDEVLRAMEPFWQQQMGNASAIHREGQDAARALAEARTETAQFFDVHADEIVFTSGATESIALALFGTIQSWKQTHPGRVPHLIVSAIEHAAVLESAQALRQQGALLTVVPVDEHGFVDPVQVAHAITHDTVIISIMMTNNEIGTIQPIEAIAREIRSWKKRERHVQRDEPQTADDRFPLLHTDAASGIVCGEARVPALGVDLLSASAAKIGGPKGVGVLVIRRGTPIAPLYYGGGQERSIRPGTEPIPLIVGFARALTMTAQDRTAVQEQMRGLQQLLITQLRSCVPSVILNGHPTDRMPNNVHVTFPGVDHEYLTILLDTHGIAVSTKSACDEREAEVSHVLLALRTASGSQLEPAGLRFTFGAENTEGDIHACIATLQQVLPLATPAK